MMFSEWINEAKREIENDKTGEKKYLHMCEETGVIPASYFLNHIQEKEFSMKYHGLGPNGAKAIAWPLKVKLLYFDMRLKEQYENLFKFAIGIIHHGIA